MRGFFDRGQVNTRHLSNGPHPLVPYMIDETVIDWSLLMRHPLATFSPGRYFDQLWRIDDEPPSAAVRALPVNWRI